MLDAQTPPAVPTTPGAAAASAKPDGPTAVEAGVMRQDLEQLARSLGKAHGVDPAAPPIQSFRAEIRLQPRRDKDSIEINIRADFQAPRSLRCEVREKGVRAERGMDPKLGPWTISNDQVVKLQGPGLNKEAEQVARELRLCRQMLRFLDPERMLSMLKTPSAVRTSDLEITKRLVYRGCTVVDGVLDSFPTYSLGTDGPTRVTLFVHPDSKQLLAVNAMPLDADGKARDLAELILLDDYVSTQELRLPSKLTVFRVAGPGREPLMTVFVDGIDLRHQFAPDHFARPRQ